MQLDTWAPTDPVKLPLSMRIFVFVGFLALAGGATSQQIWDIVSVASCVYMLIPT